ncbi:hypothetical protein [Mesoterricola silvestris]|uniref:Uncharacterized protein n=1 Tax=Mesoterricola silvestris TaxID=2927979 RepID=A0AA48K9T8_9BACT|nr:hypothetical protein [Mesoterricola silvestris]BDU73866.1 hypothetical protein METEAL_30400 [Mesoterricola silvestris]
MKTLTLALAIGLPALASGTPRQDGACILVSNESREPWTLGVDRRAALRGRLRILHFDAGRRTWTPAEDLEPGAEVLLAPGAGLRLAPLSPAYFHAFRTGEAFSGRLYLRDSRHGRILLDMARPARGGAPPVFSFVPPGCAAKFEGVLAYAFGHGDQEGYALAHIRIVGGTVSPGPGPAAPGAGPDPGGAPPDPPATRP